MKSFITWIVVIALIILGIYWITNSKNEDYNSISNSDAQTNTSVTPIATSTNTHSLPTSIVSTDSMNDVTTPIKTIEVSYTTSGFNPKTVTINKGDTIKFTNQVEGNMWVGADMHPTHTEYDDTSLKDHCATGATPSFDSCKNISKGGSYSFTFTKVGNWNYHNHSSASHKGTVVVK